MDLPTALQVTLHTGHDLYDTNFVCKMDPYVEVKVGGTTLKTNPHDRGGRNPRWEQTLTFTYNNEEFIEFRVYDKDICRDDYIGVSNFNVRSLAAVNQVHSINVPLTRGKGKSAGMLKVTIRFFGSVAASGKVPGPTTTTTGPPASVTSGQGTPSSGSPQNATAPVQVVVNTPYGPTNYPASAQPQQQAAAYYPGSVPVGYQPNQQHMPMPGYVPAMYHQGPPPPGYVPGPLQHPSPYGMAPQQQVPPGQAQFYGYPPTTHNMQGVPSHQVPYSQQVPYGQPPPIHQQPFQRAPYHQ